MSDFLEKLAGGRGKTSENAVRLASGWKIVGLVQ